MTAPWRATATSLFLAALIMGGVVGNRALAVSDETQQNLRLYTELLHAARQQYGDDVSYRDLVYGSIQGMLRTLDPHTSFLSPEAYEEMRERQQGSFFGLGILVSMRNGQLTVISPIEGTPAWRLGLRAGDVIGSIEGESTDSMSLDEAVGKLKGPKDTQVNVSIVRRGLEEPLALAITRAEIPQNTVRYAYMMDQTTGYLRLTDFSRSTAREMAEALGNLKDQGMQRLLLDLRNNGGGLLDQTVAVSNLFVPDRSRIVETRGRLPESYQSYSAEGGQEPLNIPIVVMVNEGTASAAEILSGAIQDHDLGLVMGTPTWGKGLVQTVYNLSYGAGVALTTAKYYTPSGRLIQRDYTSFYDYYTRNDNATDTDPEVLPDGVEFNTDLGRKVYGGGGITPDHLVELETAPPILQGFYSRNAFFDYAVDYHREHPDLDQDWTPPADLMQHFTDWLLERELLDQEVVDELMADERAREFAQRQIHSDLFTSAFGTETAHKVIAAGDNQIQRALEMFGEAEELLSKRRMLDSHPEVHLASSSEATGPEESPLGGGGDQP